MEGNNLKVELSQLCEWHDGFRRGILAPDMIDEYKRARYDLCNILLMAQRLAIEPGAAPRGAIRVARAYQIELGFSARQVNSITYDVNPLPRTVFTTR